MKKIKSKTWIWPRLGEKVLDGKKQRGGIKPRGLEHPKKQKNPELWVKKEKTCTSMVPKTFEGEKAAQIIWTRKKRQV